MTCTEHIVSGPLDYGVRAYSAPVLVCCTGALQVTEAQPNNFRTFKEDNKRVYCSVIRNGLAVNSKPCVILNRH